LSGLISWGPFAIQVGLLAVIAAVLTAIIAVRRFSRTHGASAKEAAELLQNAAFIAFIVWKFGHVLFAPSVVWDRPLALLMMNGGTREAGLAVTAAIVYLAVKLRRNNVPPRLFLDLMAVGAVAAVIVYAAIDWKYGRTTSLPWGLILNDPEFRYHPVSVYTVIVACIVALLLWIRRESSGTGELFRIAAMYMGLGLLAVSFGDVQQPSFLLLSSFQWQALVLAGVGIIFSFSMHNKGERR
jgi:prolipoprotein diacylglyceryltransferase